MEGLSNEYRAVVALNNMGTSLLEQGRCASAHDTLRDAVSLMKRAFRSSVPALVSGKVDHDDNSSNLQDLMRCANQRYAWSESLGPTATPTIKVTTLSCRAEPSDLNEVCKSPLPNSHELYSIRIEAEECELFSSECLDKAALLASFILFHNYAIALACCVAAHTTTTVTAASSDHPLHRNLRSMLGLCQRVLSSLCLNPTPRGGPLRRHLYLEVLMVQTYHYAMRCSGKHEEADRLQFTLERLKSSLSQGRDARDDSAYGGRARKAPAA